MFETYPHYVLMLLRYVYYRYNKIIVNDG